MSNDRDIIGRARDDPSAFAAVFDKYAALVHRYVTRRVSAQVADDVMSETFLVAFERRASFDGSEDARAWLLGIATTLIKKHVRLEARAWKGLIAADLGEVRPDVIDEVNHRLDATLAAKRIGGALGRLPAGDRDALLLYAWGDLDYEGVAAALNIPVGTVRSRLNRARSKMRIAIDPGAARTEEVEHERGLAPASDS